MSLTFPLSPLGVYIDGYVGVCNGHVLPCVQDGGTQAPGVSIQIITVMPCLSRHPCSQADYSI